MQKHLGRQAINAEVLLLIIAVLIAFSYISHAQITFDFNDPAQLTNNFVTSVDSNGTQTLGVSGGQLLQSGVAAGAVSWVYDTSPDAVSTNTSFENLTISLNFTLAANNSSIGIYFFDGGNRANSLLALFNVNSSSTNDTIRFFSGANTSNLSAGTQAGTTTTLTSGGYTVGQSYLASLTVSDLGSGLVQATFSISDPNNVLTPFSATYTYSGIASTSGEIGFRAALAAAGTNSFDNITITTIPEPSSVALFLLGIVFFGGICRTRQSRESNTACA